ncbi:hypothetical protein VDP62_03980 [Xanthomonas campestris pv. campestris]|uniref:hypothetical protein n=1 Tax=Xanthomonas campestris TaxID=339 RepID=UPI001F2D1CE5|nr:hypothetical protein [Xanthomonas campestris]MEA0759784.1 hypothetical protein [Xanthomonas campestris pv. campestris]MEB1221945.1 hypothetical protein [Xanthomonas campestris pv. campestris]MEB1242580.1 hypothetical protein [Xanthomonas campestris pv. campestris]MEB1250754.1 hypothetical protein [Xanthomonas campestris pv. campestris]MEB1292226.1 hypothetical protein [Xanthomonas campestris pv. campestris]
MVDTLPGRAGAAQVGQVLSDVGFALQSLSLAWQLSSITALELFPRNILAE